MFRDIDNPKIVTQYFSAKEIRQAKWFLFSGIAFFLHGAAYLVPERKAQSHMISAA
jgi:hypothetical protein